MKHCSEGGSSSLMVLCSNNNNNLLVLPVFRWWHWQIFSLTVLQSSAIVLYYWTNTICHTAPSLLTPSMFSFTLPLMLCGVLHRFIVEQTIHHSPFCSLPVLVTVDIPVILFSWHDSHLFCLHGYWTLFHFFFARSHRCICSLFACILIEAPVVISTSLSCSTVLFV